MNAGKPVGSSDVPFYIIAWRFELWRTVYIISWRFELWRTVLYNLLPFRALTYRFIYSLDVSSSDVPFYIISWRFELWTCSIRVFAHLFSLFRFQHFVSFGTYKRTVWWTLNYTYIWEREKVVKKDSRAKTDWPQMVKLSKSWKCS